VFTHFERLPRNAPAAAPSPRTPPGRVHGTFHSDAQPDRFRGSRRLLRPDRRSGGGCVPITLTGTPRATPRTKKSAETREQLIDATERLICEGGLTSITTQNVARECGVAEGTIYRHFPSREELIVTTLRERLPGEYRMHVDALLANVGTRDVEANLRTFITAIVPIFSAVSPALGMLAADPGLAARNADAMRADGAGPSHLIDQVSEYFYQERTLGRICPSVAPRTAAAMLVALCFYRSLMRYVFGEDPTRLSDADLSRELALIVGRGVAPTREPQETPASVS
jgi:AcrR family transcriptional regulator